MTRYPKSGKGLKWTVNELKAVRPGWKGDVLGDGDGLMGEVRVGNDGTVSVHFRYGFKWNGRKVWHYCGSWPATALERIRESRDHARALLKRGVNANDQRTAARIDEQSKVEATIKADSERRAKNATVHSLFETWVIDGVARKDGNAEIRRSFNKDVLPRIGGIAVKDVTEHDLRALLRAVVSRGANRMAVSLSCDLVQMFSWAEKRQPWRKLLQEGNPSVLVEVEKIVPPTYDLSNTRSRVLSPLEIRELRNTFAKMKDSYDAATDKRAAVRPFRTESQLALWISLATSCRIGELLMAEWKHVDLAAATWVIPKENVKGSRGTGQQQIVSLSEFAARQFRQLQDVTGADEWCFPALNHSGHVCVKSVSKQVGDRQIRFKQRKLLINRRNDDSLVLSKGTAGQWTPHDLRRTAATMMQALGISPDVIDRCQNHVLAGSRVRRHYLMHEYADEKREAWRRLGAELDAILRMPARQNGSVNHKRSHAMHSSRRGPRLVVQRVDTPAIGPAAVCGPTVARFVNSDSVPHGHRGSFSGESDAGMQHPGA